MDENKTTAAPETPVTPPAPKKVRRVGRLACALLLIAGGVLLLVQQFVPDFNLLNIMRFTPVLLILLGVELLVYTAKPDVKVKFDWLSVLGSGLVLCIVGGASLVPLVWRYVNPARDYARNNYASQLQDQAYQALNADTDLKARINSLYVSVYFNHMEDGDYTLQDEDSVSVHVELAPYIYTDVQAFTQDCYRITQLLQQSGIPADQYQFDSSNTSNATGNRYSLGFLSSFFEGLSEEQLAQRVYSTYEFEGNVYDTQAERDNAAKAELRERVIAQYQNDHEDAYPSEDYINEQVEKEFALLFPAAVPTEAPAATPETAA